MTNTLHATGKTLSGIISVLLMLAWPGIVWLSFTYTQYRWLLLVLAAFFVLRIYVFKARANVMGHTGQWLAIIGAIFCIASALLRDHALLMYYPVVINACMLLLFGGSLFSGMPIVERIARITEPDLAHAAIAYTRTVTKVWCAFFVINGSIALATCVYGDVTVWTIWNGCVSYILMAALMGGEWLVRQSVKKRI